MSPPKRAAFSINVDSNAAHISARPSSHHRDESTGPTHSHTDISYVTKPFEKTATRAVETVLESAGRTEGDLRYSNESTTEPPNTTTLGIKSKSKRRALERKYDTSEL
jgi:ribose 5-phosphate isomerase B